MFYISSRLNLGISRIWGYLESCDVGGSRSEFLWRITFYLQKAYLGIPWISVTAQVLRAQTVNLGKKKIRTSLTYFLESRPGDIRNLHDPWALCCCRLSGGTRPGTVRRSLQSQDHRMDVLSAASGGTSLGGSPLASASRGAAHVVSDVTLPAFAVPRWSGSYCGQDALLQGLHFWRIWHTGEARSGGVQSSSYPISFAFGFWRLF